MLKITLSLAVSVASLVAPAAVIVDSSKVPEYSKWAKEELQPEMEKYLPKIVKLIDGEGATVPDVDYTIFLEPKLDCPAYCAGRKICLSMEFVRAVPHEAKGACVHELVHAVQAYGYCSGRARPYRGAPGWVVEGIADWVRWLNYEGENGRKR
ncbi:MAG: hypothetical protein IKZ36_02680, partial [Kiritimatiellae bacterium]|nr:hypothetical protein [Kiritimatiellia bacterium]